MPALSTAAQKIVSASKNLGRYIAPTSGSAKAITGTGTTSQTPAAGGAGTTSQQPVTTGNAVFNDAYGKTVSVPLNGRTAHQVVTEYIANQVSQRMASAQISQRQEASQRLQGGIVRVEQRPAVETISKGVPVYAQAGQFRGQPSPFETGMVNVYYGMGGQALVYEQGQIRGSGATRYGGVPSAQYQPAPTVQAYGALELARATMARQDQPYYTGVANLKSGGLVPDVTGGAIIYRSQLSQAQRTSILSNLDIYKRTRELGIFTPEPLQYYERFPMGRMLDVSAQKSNVQSLNLPIQYMKPSPPEDIWGTPTRQNFEQRVMENQAREQGIFQGQEFKNIEGAANWATQFWRGIEINVPKYSRQENKLYSQNIKLTSPLVPYEERSFLGQMTTIMATSVMAFPEYIGAQIFTTPRRAQLLIEGARYAAQEHRLGDVWRNINPFPTMQINLPTISRQNGNIVLGSKTYGYQATGIGKELQETVFNPFTVEGAATYASAALFALPIAYTKFSQGYVGAFKGSEDTRIQSKTFVSPSEQYRKLATVSKSGNIGATEFTQPIEYTMQGQKVAPTTYARILESEGKISLRTSYPVEVGRIISEGGRTAILPAYRGLMEGYDRLTMGLNKLVTLSQEGRNVRTYTAFEKELTAAHELIHFQTPSGLRINLPFYESSNFMYRASPSELISFGLQNRFVLKGFSVTSEQVSKYFDISKSMIQYRGESNLAFQYVRNQVGLEKLDYAKLLSTAKPEVYPSGTFLTKTGAFDTSRFLASIQNIKPSMEDFLELGRARQAPKVTISTGTTRVGGISFDYFSTQVGRDLYGMKIGKNYDVFFQKLGSGMLDIRTLQKETSLPASVREQIGNLGLQYTNPDFERNLVINRRIVEYSKETIPPLGRPSVGITGKIEIPIDMGVREGEQLLYNLRNVNKIARYGAVGKGTITIGGREISSFSYGKAESTLSQIDQSGEYLKSFSNLIPKITYSDTGTISSSWIRELRNVDLRKTNIEYVVQPTWLPHERILGIEQGKGIVQPTLSYEMQASLYTRIRTGYYSEFQFTKEVSAYNPLTQLRESTSRFLDINRKMFSSKAAQNLINIFSTEKEIAGRMKLEIPKPSIKVGRPTVPEIPSLDLLGGNMYSTQGFINLVPNIRSETVNLNVNLTGNIMQNIQRSVNENIVAQRVYNRVYNREYLRNDIRNYVELENQQMQRMNVTQKQQQQQQQQQLVDIPTFTFVPNIPVRTPQITIPDITVPQNYPFLFPYQKKPKKNKARAFRQRRLFYVPSLVGIAKQIRGRPFRLTGLEVRGL